MPGGGMKKPAGEAGSRKQIASSEFDSGLRSPLNEELKGELLNRSGGI
jgi:hypothetical protein